jgi:tetratricopeptide (TPR) repeat protein
MRRSKALLLLCLLLQACSGLPLKEYAETLGPRRQLDVPFIAQQQYYCGPAALAEVAQYRGIDADQNDLAKQLFIPGKKGSLAVEMQAASRKLGLLPYPLAKNFHALLQELDAGNPVLVFQNLTFSWWPQWHYALAVGYDLAREELILHSGDRPYYRLPFSTFMATWSRTNNWARVMVDSSHLPVTAEPLVTIRSAYAFEQTGHPELAAGFYALAAERWPDSLPVLTAQANLALAQGESQRAIQVFERLLALAKDDPALWNNYAYALLAGGCKAQALTAISRAEALAPEDDAYRESASEIRAAEAAAEHCSSEGGEPP